MDFVSFARKGDCVLHLEQDDSKRTVKVVDFNSEAEATLGFTTRELEGKDLSSLLTDKNADIIESYLSFEENNLDLVMSKMKQFDIKKKDGNFIKMTKKVFFVGSEGEKLYYELLLRKPGFMEHFEKYCCSFESYRPPKFDTRIGLMTKDSALEELGMMVQFAKSKPANVVLCLVDFPSAENVGEDFISKVVLVKETVRNSDILAHFGPGRILIFLVDCKASDAEAVCGRIKEKLLNDSRNALMGYVCLEEYTSKEDLIEDLSKQVDLAKS